MFLFQKNKSEGWISRFFVSLLAVVLFVTTIDMVMYITQPPVYSPGEEKMDRVAFLLQQKEESPFLENYIPNEYKRHLNYKNEYDDIFKLNTSSAESQSQSANQPHVRVITDANSPPPPQQRHPNLDSRMTVAVAEEKTNSKHYHGSPIAVNSKGIDDRSGVNRDRNGNMNVNENVNMIVVSGNEDNNKDGDDGVGNKEKEKEKENLFKKKPMSFSFGKTGGYYMMNRKPRLNLVKYKVNSRQIRYPPDDLQLVYDKWFKFFYTWQHRYDWIVNKPFDINPINITTLDNLKNLENLQIDFENRKKINTIENTETTQKIEKIENGDQFTKNDSSNRNNDSNRNITSIMNATSSVEIRQTQKEQETREPKQTKIQTKTQTHATREQSQSQKTIDTEENITKTSQTFDAFSILNNINSYVEQIDDLNISNISNTSLHDIFDFTNFLVTSELIESAHIEYPRDPSTIATRAQEYRGMRNTGTGTRTVAPTFTSCNFTGKVFGLGMMKTGTLTLNQAVTNLGYFPSADSHEISIHHWGFDPYYLENLIMWLPRDEMIAVSLWHPYIRDKLLNVVDNTITTGDMPWASFYPVYDRLYPNAKFVLTVRNSNRDVANSHIKTWAWIATGRQKSQANNGNNNRNNRNRMVRNTGPNLVWKTLDDVTWPAGNSLITGYDLAYLLAWRYDTHTQMVLKYFKDKYGEDYSENDGMNVRDKKLLVINWEELKKMNVDNIDLYTFSGLIDFLQCPNIFGESRWPYNKHDSSYAYDIIPRNITNLNWKLYWYERFMMINDGKQYAQTEIDILSNENDNNTNKTIVKDKNKNKKENKKYQTIELIPRIYFAKGRRFALSITEKDWISPV